MNKGKPMIKELSLRPYLGRLFFTNTKKEYEAKHKKIFVGDDILNCSHGGRFSGGEGKDGSWTYLIYAEDVHNIAHELSHVVLHIFERCGIDPREANGEPFCYMISQLILDAK
jgi:hypothetical protein